MKWAHLHPKIHGAAEHTDVTRTLFIPVSGAGSGGFLMRIRHSVMRLDPTAPETASCSFRVPNDFVSFTSLKLVWFSMSTGTAGNDWVVDPDCEYSANGEGRATHTQSPANTTIDVTVLEAVYETDIGFTVVALAKGDYIGVRIQREAGDGADTYESDVCVLGMLLTYVAEQ